jgi:chemotaxis protein methyltransferase CheR
MLLKDESVFVEFVQDLSITVTEMFRDPPFYKSLREKVIKRLATYPVIKVWIAGCATGEEVYSVAILLKEEGLLDRSIIYATDINQKSLYIAKEGIYSLETMKTYSENYLKAGGRELFSTYYRAKYNSVLFEKSLKENVVFSPHNLAADKSFNEFQLIICRNVLMYFNRNLQNRVLALFHDSLCHFGFLGLGDKESLLFSEKKDCFEETDKKEKIYMKVK